jgi:flagellar M-ring protein FliF
MSGVLANLSYVCSEIWKEIGIAQRVSIVLVTLLGMLALGAVLYFGTQPNWQVLYSGMPQETAARIYEMARESNIPVKLTDGGTTVRVPYRHASDLRAQVARSDIDVTEKGVGLELFDDLKLGMTDMQQRVGFQRALQGELERMIAAVDGVERARVMLAMPERRAFMRKNAPRAQASVFVETGRNRTLRRAQVQSICRMVANAVAELRPQDVVVTDSNGELLAAGLGDEAGAGAAGFSPYIELQHSMEQRLKEKAEATLRPIVGDGAVVAVVNVELDTREIETTTERYDPTSAVIVSERITSEDNLETDRQNGKAAGTTSNMVSVESPEAPASPLDQSKESRKTVENQYLVPKTIERVTGRNPEIRHLSVAVTVAASDQGPRDQAVLQQYRQLVMSSVGAVENGESDRTDTVTVVEGAFAPPSAPLPPAAPSALDRAQMIAQGIPAGTAGRIALGAVFLFVLYRMFSNTLRKSQLSSVDLDQTQAESASSPQLVAQERVNPLGALEDVEHAPMAKLQSRAKESPEEVAAALEDWVARDKVKG